jgi:hypothetical protein
LNYHLAVVGSALDLNFEAGNGLFQAKEHMKFVLHKGQMHVIEDDWMHTKSCLRVADGTVEEARATVKMTAKVAAEALALLDQQTQYLHAMGHFLFDEDQDDNDNDDDDDDNDENGDDQNNDGVMARMMLMRRMIMRMMMMILPVNMRLMPRCLQLILKCKRVATKDEKEFDSDDDDTLLAQLVGPEKAAPVDPELFSFHYPDGGTMELLLNGEHYCSS